jgi:hypothetical protein
MRPIALLLAALSLTGLCAGVAGGIYTDDSLRAAIYTDDSL